MIKPAVSKKEAIRKLRRSSNGGSEAKKLDSLNIFNMKQQCKDDVKILIIVMLSTLYI